MPDADTLPLGRLSRASDTEFRLEPDATARAALAEDLGIDALRKLRFEGRVIPEGKRDWRLEARLGATVVQPCVVTLDPVTTRIEQAVTRRFMEDVPQPDAEIEEIEIPEDDSVEPLPATLNLSDVMADALALALPLYPRADGVDLGAAVFAPPGVAPMTDEDAKPLAGLAALKDRLQNPTDPEKDPEE